MNTENRFKELVEHFICIVQQGYVTIIWVDQLVPLLKQRTIYTASFHSLDNCAFLHIITISPLFSILKVLFNGILLNSLHAKWKFRTSLYDWYCWTSCGRQNYCELVFPIKSRFIIIYFIFYVENLLHYERIAYCNRQMTNYIAHWKISSSVSLPSPIFRFSKI